MGSEVGKKRAEDAGVGGPGLLSFSFFLKKREGERVEFFFFFFWPPTENRQRDFRSRLSSSLSPSLLHLQLLTEVNITQTTPSSPALSSSLEKASMSRTATTFA